jgi:hypothetical protein
MHIKGNEQGRKTYPKCSEETRDLFDQFVLLQKNYVWLEGL